MYGSESNLVDRRDLWRAIQWNNLKTDGEKKKKQRSWTRQKNRLVIMVTFLIGNGNGKDYQTDYLTNADQAIPNWLVLDYILGKPKL